jgi:hypothetical protein
MAILPKETGLVTATITAQNTFSDGLYTKGSFNLSIWGTFVATITVQRSFDLGSTWLDVDTFDAPIETVGTDPEAVVVYRAGVKTGDFTSGTVNIRIGL